jgi:hypothetical protein
VTLRGFLRLALFGAFIASRPALACDTGPFAVEFPMGSTFLGNDAKRELSYGKDMVRSAGFDRGSRERLEIAFYILDERGRVQSPDFWRARRRNVERYLKSIGVPLGSFSIIFRRAVQKPIMRAGERLQNTDVTVNLAEGGCG